MGRSGSTQAVPVGRSWRALVQGGDQSDVINQFPDCWAVHGDCSCICGVGWQRYSSNVTDVRSDVSSRSIALDLLH